MRGALRVFGAVAPRWRPRWQQPTGCVQEAPFPIVHVVLDELRTSGSRERARFELAKRDTTCTAEAWNGSGPPQRLQYRAQADRQSIPTVRRTLGRFR